MKGVGEEEDDEENERRRRRKERMPRLRPAEEKKGLRGVFSSITTAGAKDFHTEKKKKNKKKKNKQCLRVWFAEFQILYYIMV